MAIRFILFISGLSILFSGCAVVLDYNPAILRFDTPETQGKFLSGSVSIMAASTPKRILGRIYSSFPSDVNPSENYDSPAEYTESTFAMGSRLDLGMLRNFDIYYRRSNDSPNIVGFKTQIIGDSRHQKSSGLKMSMSVEYGLRQTSKESNSGENSNREMFSYDVAANIGFRVNKFVIVYVNNFYNVHYIHGTLSRGSSVYESPEYDKEGKSKAIGSLLGIRYSERRKGPYLGFEYGRSYIKWPQTNQQNRVEKSWTNSYGLNAGYTW